MPEPLEYYSGGVAAQLVRIYTWRPVRAPAELAPIYIKANRGSLPEALDIVQHWAGMIEGTVKVQGAPARSRVVALEGKGLTPKLHTYSDPVTGRFRLYPLVAGPRKYLVMSQDSKVRFNAVVYDGVATVPWEDEE